MLNIYISREEGNRCKVCRKVHFERAHAGGWFSSELKLHRAYYSERYISISINSYDQEIGIN